MRQVLDATVLARLERAEVTTRRRLVGSLAGQHRSSRFGSSLDFADYREYQPGDDLRLVDVAAAARLDRLLIRLFEAEDEIAIRLIVDTSASMEGKVLARATELAAALGFVGLRQRDVIDLYVMGGDSIPVPRRLSGDRGVAELFDTLSALKADGQTPLAEVTQRVLRQSTRPGVTVVVSDLFSDQWDLSLRRLPARGSDLVVVHLIDPADDLGVGGSSNQTFGDLQLVDRETGEGVDVSLSAATLRSYRKREADWRNNVASVIRSVGGTYVSCDVSVDLESFLFGDLLQAVRQ